MLLSLLSGKEASTTGSDLGIEDVLGVRLATESEPDIEIETEWGNGCT